MDLCPPACNTSFLSRLEILHRSAWCWLFVGLERFSSPDLLLASVSAGGRAGKVLNVTVQLSLPWLSAGAGTDCSAWRELAFVPAEEQD